MNVLFFATIKKNVVFLVTVSAERQEGAGLLQARPLFPSLSLQKLGVTTAVELGVFLICCWTDWPLERRRRCSIPDVCALCVCSCWTSLSSSASVWSSCCWPTPDTGFCPWTRPSPTGAPPSVARRFGAWRYGGPGRTNHWTQKQIKDRNENKSKTTEMKT